MFHLPFLFARMPIPARLTGHGLLASVAALVLALTGQAVAAQAIDTGEEIQAQAKNWADAAAVEAKGTHALRMEASVGALDSRLKLARCAKMEYYVPPGTSLWGKTRVGVRCLDSTVKWNVFLPVTVKAFGPAWVIKGDVPSGNVLKEDDAVEAEVDWADQTSPIMSQRTQWIGMIAARPMSTGLALRQSMVKPPQAFQAGAQVRVIAQGQGFQISSDGQALSAGVIGQIARVRMENGRVMSGMVLDTRTVKLDL
jgi:flagellar basal body P-ring formation protein FlgA